MPVDVSAPLPQLDLKTTSTITVTLDDPAATITRLVVHGWQEDGTSSPTPGPVQGAYLPGEV